MANERSRDKRRFRIFQSALWQKASKYIFSGLIIIGIGCLVISSGLLLNRETSTPLVVGLGAIVVLVGIIRVLIGLINPAHPDELPPEEEPKSPGEELHEVIFDKDVLAQEENRD